ncbi:MAG: hypothetical protein HY402_02840 [Elusimicrobia bacterium]|nr:hypothetical protein [Elusimicrobiota bacterium]
MIVVAIIGILAAIAIPKFADLIRKSKEGATKGNLGSIRSTLAIYYGDNEGWYPAGTDGADLTVLVPTYIQEMPESKPDPYHSDSTSVEGLTTPDDDGGWDYNNSQTNTNWGVVWVSCSVAAHTDTKGNLWTSY